MFNLGLALLACGVLLSLMWEAAGLLIGLVGLGVWVWAVLRFLRDRWRGVPVPPAQPLGRPQPLAVGGVTLEDDRPVALDDPEVPAAVREAAQRDAQPGDVLWRCVRQGARTGPLARLGWGRRPLLVEWWLMSAEGDLIKSYWLER